MWCGAPGATLAQSSWDHLRMWPPRICIEQRERFTSSTQPRSRGGVRRTNPLQAESGVICLTGDTAINLPPPSNSPLPRIKSAPGNTSAPTTCRQDKQSSMPKFCHVCLMCERSSDNVFITSALGARLSKKKDVLIKNEIQPLHCLILQLILKFFFFLVSRGAEFFEVK